ncbi:MAG: HDOD domain-containing protein [Desulfuromonadaceae bacterium]|nr:HDOD domain-containing protein [Desulfuromonadaceae bacterium]
MNSILFVDDNPHLLSGLKRGLRPLREQWDMHFVTSGEDALAYLATHPVDVVISDYRMPGLSGFELLSRVQKEYPSVIRIMLTGQPDRDTYDESIGVCHYFLWKPLETEKLLPLLERLAELNGLLEHPELIRHLRGLTSLPTLPAAYQQLLQILNDPEENRLKLVRLVGGDVALTLQILKMVNSSFIGLVREIKTLDEAIQYLGINTIRSLVLAQHIFTFHVADTERDQLHQLWMHSCTTARLAETLIREQGYNDLQAYTSFAGLLHDIGKLILIHCLPERHREIHQLIHTQQLSTTDAEQKVLGTTHAAIGAYLAQLWGLPHSIVEAIYLHQQPEDSVDALPPMAAAVWHANRLSHGDTSASARAYQLLRQCPTIRTLLETLVEENAHE